MLCKLKMLDMEMVWITGTSMEPRWGSVTSHNQGWCSFLACHWISISSSTLLPAPMHSPYPSSLCAAVPIHYAVLCVSSLHCFLVLYQSLLQISSCFSNVRLVAVQAWDHVDYSFLQKWGLGFLTFISDPHAESTIGFEHRFHTYLCIPFRYFIVVTETTRQLDSEIAKQLNSKGCKSQPDHFWSFFTYRSSNFLVCMRNRTVLNFIALFWLSNCRLWTWPPDFCLIHTVLVWAEHETCRKHTHINLHYDLQWI